MDEIPLMEGPSVTVSSYSQNTNKYVSGKVNVIKVMRDESSPEENSQQAAKRRKKKIGGSEEAPANIVEQVACFKCKFCNFLSLSEDAVTLHVQEDHSSRSVSVCDLGMQCPGCNNVFYSHKSLKVHLSEDHNVAQGELENILKAFSYSNNGQGSQQSSVDDSLVKLQDIEGVLENVGNSVGSNDHDIHNFAGPIVHTRRSSKSSQHIEYVNEAEAEKCGARDTSSPQSGSIPLRRLSVIEQTPKGKIACEVVKNKHLSEKCDSKKFKASSAIRPIDSQKGSVSAARPNSLQHQSNVRNDENAEMDTQYDMDSVQILDIALEPQQSESHEHLNQQLDNAGSRKSLPSMVVDSGNRYCTVTASPISCEEIIDEICQGEGMGEVMYVEEGDLGSGKQSPLMVCFASSSGDVSGNEEEYNVDIDNESATIIIEGNENDNSLSERMVLSKCTFDGSTLVGADGKRLVKRGYVKRDPAAKKEPRILSTSQRRRRNRDSNGEESPTYRCNVLGCCVRLRSQENIEYHQRCHVLLNVSEEASEETLIQSVDKTKFDCPECLTRVQSWKLMRSHLWKYHSIDIELYTCDQCGFKTPSLSNMRNVHEKIHGSEKPHLCDTCGKGFKTIKQLRNHKAIHNRREGVVEHCEVCGRSFNSNRMLRNHINTVHNKVRPYMCSECGHTAANRSSLKMHLRQHTGDRPYKCEECDYSSADHNSLRRHKKRHTGDKPYKCQYCGYACIQSSTYKTHLRKKHPGQDIGLVFTCKRCPFHTVSNDIFLAHTAEHDIADACGIPLALSRPSQRRPRKTARKRRLEIEDESVADELPIFVSIATDDASGECESPNFEKIVQHVSEAIVPGSNLHVLYNSINLSNASMKNRESVGDSIDIHDSLEDMGDDSELELVAEVTDASAMVEIPSEEIKYRLRKRL